MLIKLIIVLILFIISNTSFSQSISDYLILQDIGLYKLDRPEEVFPREPPIGGPRVYDGSGIIGATGHFPDHRDVTYEVMYIGGGGFPSPTVQVTQHVGADSDKWLLHEVEDGYRTNDAERLGLLTKGVRLREINGNKYISLRGSSYSWISDRVVVEISYTDLYGNKPEPLEIVQAYVQKFPSTIPAGFVLDRAHDERWIKNEMERRLWLCDRWFLQLQMGKVELNETLEAVVKSLAVFLNYREKYYGIKAADEGGALLTSLNQKDGTSIKNKLTTYKTWWAVNKPKSISLP